MFTLIVRLRYRVVSNKVKWFFAIQQIDKAWETAIDEACAKVQKETGFRCSSGRPRTRDRPDRFDETSGTGPEWTP